MKLVIGYGSTLHQDDGVGWHIAGQLTEQLKGAEVEIIQAHQLVPELSAAAARAEHVIFVDAAVDEPPGSIHVTEISPMSNVPDAHALLPYHILYLTGQLFQHWPRAHLVTISGAAFELGEGLSEPVAAALPEALSTIKHLLAVQPAGVRSHESPDKQIKQL